MASSLLALHIIAAVHTVLPCVAEVSNLKSFGNEANILIIINLFFASSSPCASNASHTPPSLFSVPGLLSKVDTKH